MTLRNEIRYDVGCTYADMCNKNDVGSIFGKRSDHSHILCQKCCNNTHVCNVERTCNAVLQVPTQKCLTCGAIERPEMCNATTTCLKDEICFSHKYLTESGHQHFDLGCKHSTLCLHGSNTITFGRRMDSGRHLLCETCCSGNELCNRNLNCSHHSQLTFNSSCSSTNVCTSNLICNNGRCQCVSNEYFWADYACFRRKSANEGCTQSDQCQQTLQCIGQKCKCKITEYWNGSLCTLKKSYNDGCSSPEECGDTLVCSLGYCKCDRTNYWTGRKCAERKTYNMTCSITDECKDSLLRCLNGKCTCISAEYWTGMTCAIKPTECADIRDNRDGVYTIFPPGSNHAVSVFCIMCGKKKWTVIQRRVNGSLSFDRNWNEYKHGFGSPYGEYWLGNDNIHKISTNGHHEISIYLEESSSKFGYANYSTFHVGDEGSKYILNITGYSGNTSNEMDGSNSNGWANRMMFSTPDQDNDRTSTNYGGNCAAYWKGGWWYNGCFGGNVNIEDDRYWENFSRRIKKTIMMIRRSS